MFNGTAGDLACIAAGGSGDADDRHVVGLSAAAGKYYLCRVRASGVCHLFTCVIDGASGDTAEAMAAGSIAVLGGHEWQHGIEYARIKRSRAIVVHIDAGIIHFRLPPAPLLPP